MSLLNAVPYRKFIEVLYLMDACIPALPSDSNRSFMVYQSSGSGYYPTPSGPRCPVMSRDNDELMPAFEVEKLLNLLGFPLDNFLATLSGCQAMEESKGSTLSSAQSDN